MVALNLGLAAASACLFLMDEKEFQLDYWQQRVCFALALTSVLPRAFKVRKLWRFASSVVQTFSCSWKRSTPSDILCCGPQ
ncbi:hypothetical protein L218DRAFT_415905 [Marasmius fiardii PR-910]|nr:hypothetical protein L218DRAFT_415905 [Marasmius fiardii PR-910]